MIADAATTAVSNYSNQTSMILIFGISYSIFHYFIIFFSFLLLEYPNFTTKTQKNGDEMGGRAKKISPTKGEKG